MRRNLLSLWNLQDYISATATQNFQMSNSSQRTRSSSRHLNVASEARTSPRRQQIFYTSIVFPTIQFTSWNEILHPPSNQLLYQSRNQTFYPSTTFSSRKTFQTCTKCTWKPSCPEYIAHPDVNLVQQHFNRIRNRPPRLPSNNGMSDDEDSDRRNPSWHSGI